MPLSRAWVARPHVFVDYAALVRFGAGGVESVEITWIGDEFTSACVMEVTERAP